MHTQIHTFESANKMYIKLNKRERKLNEKIAWKSIIWKTATFC